VSSKKSYSKTLQILKNRKSTLLHPRFQKEDPSARWQLVFCCHANWLIPNKSKSMNVPKKVDTISATITINKFSNLAPTSKNIGTEQTKERWKGNAFQQTVPQKFGMFVFAFRPILRPRRNEEN